MTSSPPSTGPSAGAKVVGTVRMAEARMRSSGGNARYSMAIPTGASMPPPAPCRTRNATSSGRLCAWPHRADAIVNTAIAMSSTRLPPNRSPSQPDAGMNTARLTRKPMEMLSTAVGVTEKSRPMVGRATLTIVTSMIDMNMAATNTTLTATFWLIRARTAVSPRSPAWSQPCADHRRRRPPLTQTRARASLFPSAAVAAQPGPSSRALPARPRAPARPAPLRAGLPIPPAAP